MGGSHVWFRLASAATFTFTHLFLVKSIHVGKNSARDVKHCATSAAEKVPILTDFEMPMVFFLDSINIILYKENILQLIFSYMIFNQ